MLLSSNPPPERQFRRPFIRITRPRAEDSHRNPPSDRNLFAALRINLSIRKGRNSSPRPPFVRESSREAPTAMTVWTRTIQIVLLAALLPAAGPHALRAQATQPSDGRDADAPTSQPAREEEPADLAKDILSYDALEEEVRFVVAAGEGRDLTEAAFAENRKRHNPFVRRFDRWEAIVLFDRNASGTISWSEAHRYRQALRKALLAAYDADHDGLLTGEERAAANKTLAEGNLPPLKDDGAAKATRPTTSPAALTDEPPSGENITVEADGETP
jgi:hypothetical protein